MGEGHSAQRHFLPGWSLLSLPHPMQGSPAHGERVGGLSDCITHSPAGGDPVVPGARGLAAVDLCHPRGHVERGLHLRGDVPAQVSGVGGRHTCVMAQECGGDTLGMVGPG